MPKIAPRFKLEYFPRGGAYSAQSEYQRFVTVDYNMESYVGVVGVGVIEGWEIEHLTDTTVQILPGRGIINGYFAESPYTVKQRSSMVSGDREVEVVKLQEAPEEDMTDAEADAYIAVVQEYDPTFNPTKPIENAYVKVVIPEVITLNNNADTYIWVTRKYSNFYPPLADYPPYLIPEPSVNDYNDFNDYIVAKEAYDTQMDAIYSYQFRDDSANHFTEVTFNSAPNFSAAPAKVLLGLVTTRGNEVVSIDTSDVNTLKNLESTITSYANQIVAAHHHGGSASYDPARINLETDFRNAVLTSYNPESRRGNFSITESQLTDTVEGHRHTFTIDTDGNGQTVGIVGTADNHYHKIVENEMQTQEFTTGTVEDHTHVLPDISNFVWDESSQYIVYVNNIPVGDETSDDITADPTTKTISLTGIIGGITKTYGVDFEYEGTRFQYSEQQSSVYRFMLNMITEFNASFASVDINTNPFVFFDEETQSIAGFADLKSQSVTAEALLRDKDDTFVFTPDAARNIEVTLLDYQKTVGLEADHVTIEILGNSEVTGVIRNENIFFVNAQKIASGVFEISQIPFLSHVGRTDEPFSPFNYPVISNDGINFLVTPSVTENTLDHYHNLLVNEENTGLTEQTYINDEPVYYAVGQDDETYLVAHLHSVQDGVVEDAESQGLLDWQNDINETTETDSSHTHEIIQSVIGDVKVAYSMFEDRFGNLYVGTSDDLIMIPNDDAFVFVINDLPFYETGTDLLEMFEKAKQNYEIETGTPLKITSDIYTLQIALAEETLTETGDSYLIVGKSESNSDADQTMIQKLSYIPVPNYKITDLKDFDEVGDDETLIAVQLRDVETNELLDPESEEVQERIAENPGSVKTVAKVERYLDGIPAISIEVQEITRNGVTTDKILTVGKDIVATNVNLQDNFYLSWEAPNTPSNVGVFKNAEQDEEGSVWVASNNGVLVLRSHNRSTILSNTTRPGESPNINDILVFTSNNVYCASDGIFKTEDQGKTWVEKLEGNYNQIEQDFKSMKVTTKLGHTHTLDVNINGNGTLELEDGHTHDVTDWTVQSANGHTHSLVITLYAVSNTKVYRSKDSGETWNFICNLPEEGENGKFFAYDGIMYLSKPDGIYRYSGGWNKISDIVAYSFQVSYDLESFFVGSVNEVYEYSSSFTSKFSFSGSPLPSLTLNGENVYFDYAYGNRSKTFYLKEITVTDQTITTLVNFDKWYAESGGWPTDVPYDIYINSKLIYSTKTDIDNRASRGWSFTVDPTLGLVDFSGTSSLTNGLSVYDNFIEVEDASQFQAGDRISIRKDELPPPTETVVAGGESGASAEQAAEAEAQRSVEEREVETSYLYRTITSVSDNIISFSPRSTIKIDTPATVYKLPNLDASSAIRLNIYDSFLTNIGTNTHEEIEDRLSYESDQRPYELNNAYLSNLLQLTQAVRYVYPEIDSEMIQSLFYDFHYSENPADENYYGNYIDIENSEAYSLVNFQSPFEAKGATSINKILIGTGTFSGNIIVGTDIGVFWARRNDNVNANWFYVWGLKRPVYDMSVFGDENLLVATDNGVYLTQDMITWTLQDQEAVRFPALSMSLRWPEDSFVVIPPHEASFKNIEGDPTVGIIKAAGGIYSELVPNRAVKIETISDPSNPKNNTSYVIVKATPNSIQVSPPFEEDPETIASVRLTMGSWWQQFDGEENLGNVDLTNTLLVGGKNKIAYTPYLGDFVWTSGLFDATVENVNIVNFLPISTGGILASAAGTDLSNVIHYILRSSDLGKVWSTYRKFEEVRGTIQSSKVSTFGHTIMSVSYTYPNDFRYADGELDKRNISIFAEGNDTPIFSGRVIFNSGFDSSIVVLGREANETIQSQSGNLAFEVYPVVVNDMVEADNGNILFGTDIGVYEDSQTTTGEFPYDGQIWSVGFPGQVTNIDVSGLIKSISVNPVNNAVVLSIEASDTISANQYKGRTLYVVDLPIVAGYTIAENSSRTIGGEITVELETEFVAIWLTYVGKRIKFVGDRSVLDVDFDFLTQNNQLANGKIYVSTDQNGNLGKEYTVVSNTSNQIIIDGTITPYNAETPDSTNEDIIPGQSFVGIDSSGKVNLDVVFTQNVVDNFLVDFDFQVTNGDSDAALIEGMTVYQNSRNKIILNDFSSLINTEIITTPVGLIIGSDDVFRLTGPIYQPLSSFNNKITSTDSSHYHDLDLVGGFVSGSIASFEQVLNATVKFEVSDTSLFNNALVQKDGTLFKDARIRFWNPLEIGVEYFSEVVQHTATTMTVKLLNNTNWDFTEYNNIKISETWSWEINATNYGYTKNIYYDDFVTSTHVVTEDIELGDSTIKVEDTTNMVNGDKITIISSANKSETNFIKSVIDSTTIKLEIVASNAYFVANTVQVKVLRDEFSNTHEHMVRNNQVETIQVEDYLIRGLPSQHTHRNTALIDVVSDMKKDQNNILVVGSSSFIYNSEDDGNTWENIADLNDFVEGNLEVNGIVRVESASGQTVAGTTGGEIFSTKKGSSEILPLIQPEVN